MPSAAVSSVKAKDSGELRLGFPGFSFADLFSPQGLKRLHDLFWAETEKVDTEVVKRFVAYRDSRGQGMSGEDISERLIELGPHLGAFVAKLFGVEAEVGAQRSWARTLDPVWIMKEQLIRRRASKLGSLAPDAALIDRCADLLRRGGCTNPDDETQVAKVAALLLEAEPLLKRKLPPPEAGAALLASFTGLFDGDERARLDAALDTLSRALVMRRDALNALGWVSFRLPHDLDYDNLVQLRRPRADLPEMFDGHAEHRRARDGFSLTDPRMPRAEWMSEVDYCLYCHGRDKDSCSKGLREKTGAIKQNSLGIELNGCPLDEKISEAHYLAKRGEYLGALACITIDNPMAPGTGHRICNDCMKACVFQKQEPVNIPQAETGILMDVLRLPWGFEIYGLLSRWNPLNVIRPYPLPYHGKNVLVVGLGPAGYTLAHHLLNEGFGVVGIDGLKIEPLPRDLVEKPVRDYAALEQRLDKRIMYGFGGVSEYGITVRWDKNFLTVLYVTLARRDKARFFGGIRFGGTMKLEDAWDLGFHHVAIAAGAGKPTIVDMENNLIRGIRKASDFLMALQLTGAYKDDNLANLQVRLPAIVIGGGLTAIDTATELRAYYPVQVEKVLNRYEALCKEKGEAVVRQRYSAEEIGILDELVGHGKAVRAERQAAAAAGRAPSFNALLDQWGGVTLAYRKSLNESPAYRLNHEEVVKFLEEGPWFVENVSPKTAVPDEYGALKSVVFTRKDGSTVDLPARTLCVAAGTSPNTIYERENPGVFALNKKGFFAAHDASRDAAGKVTLTPGTGFFTSYLDPQGHTVSYYGDNHPKYAGSVVKAMASAKDGHREVVRLFAPEVQAALTDNAAQAGREQAFAGFAARLEAELLVTVHQVNRLTPTIVEVVLKAPLQSRKFEPGQFYRLQNYETLAPVVDGTRLLMEGLALTGAWVDKAAGLLSLIVLEMGGSSRLCAALKPGEPVVVMGPTGAPTEIPAGESVLLAGGGLGNAVLFSIARALRDKGCKVIYFAGYKNPQDVFKRDEVEAGTDQVIWATDVEPAIEPRRPQDRSFVGNIVQAIQAYGAGQLGEQLVPLSDVSRIIAIGSDRMMAAVAKARHGVLKPLLKHDHVGVGSINSPMQCMMKEVCAQCLQRHLDPVTGKVASIVFTCFNQDQELDKVDWQNLNDRLRQNTVQEKLTSLWLDRLFEKAPELRRV